MKNCVLLLAGLLAACGASSPPLARPAGCTPFTRGALPDGCEILFDGCCYPDRTLACAAAGCPDHCVILRSYPGQVQCQ